MSGTFWTIEQVEPIIKERNELRQRVAELEAAYAERGERMKSMREWIENDPEDNGGVSFFEHYGAYKWFDPETGEPL